MAKKRIKSSSVSTASHRHNVVKGNMVKKRITFYRESEGAITVLAKVGGQLYKAKSSCMCSACRPRTLRRGKVLGFGQVFNKVSPLSGMVYLGRNEDMYLDLGI